MTRRKSVKKPEIAKKIAKQPVLVPRPNGRGALLTGGVPGHKGGPGRPSSALREAMRDGLGLHVPTLLQIAGGAAVQRMKIGDVETDTLVSADVSDRLRAIDTMAKYGLGTIKEVSVEDVRERVQRTLDVIQERTSPEQFVSIVQQLQPIWA